MQLQTSLFKLCHVCLFHHCGIGAVGRIRTYNLSLIRQLLRPLELQQHFTMYLAIHLFGCVGGIRTHVMTESKSVAFPLGYNTLSAFPFGICNISVPFSYCNIFFVFTLCINYVRYNFSVFLSYFVLHLTYIHI